MKHTKTIVLVIALLMTAVLLPAQSVDTGILSIGMGTLFGYNLNSSDLGTGQELYVGFGLSDNLEAGFHFINGDGVSFPDYRLFSIAYAASPVMGLSIYGGQEATLSVAAAGLGYYLNLFRNDVAGSLTTLLKLRIEYLINENIPPEKGLLNIALQGKIAF